MRKGEIPNDVESRYMNEELEDPTDKISTILSSEIPEGSIHVLVVVPVDPTTVMLKQQNEEDGSSVHNGTYLSFWWDLFSSLWPLEKIHSTKKDV
ncbi:hypothetical protein PC116_g7250 [Phytophthora cactorum]|nr:hypothetical protein Pcac1_g20271 [Phytophthora cactorum]KAG2877175.1 hypothetical protein PC114_g23797 [Phytophthora cactorum]KAG3083013.1 hypothetical protein PC121_g5853 [Phytophthora cactorum]KAG3128713.1 hypothetical protein C6341_g24431 [Phytophthora cactorum]KAG4040434.1 hypothetical protein PC123_g24025 [Phytophthora cactorum]